MRQILFRRGSIAGLLAGILAALLLMASPAFADPVDAGPADAGDGVFAAAEAGVSYLGQWSAGELTPSTAAFSLRAGYRLEAWDFFAVASQEMWFDRELGNTVNPILNVGAGVGLVHIDGMIRSSVRAGPSLLMFDTRLAQSGQIGAFVEVRPAGFRLPFADAWTVELHPLGFVLTSPVLTEIPLFKASYRTSLAVEATF